MSFSSKVKNEICSQNICNISEIYSELYAMLLFSGKIKQDTILMSYENENIVKRLSNMLERVSEELNIKNIYRITEKESKRNSLNIEVLLKDNFIDKNHLENPKFEIIQKNYIKEFLRGAFLASGSITDPEIDYHLEFNVSSIKHLEILLSVINSFKDFNFNPKFIQRRNSYSVYIKENQKIEDFLVLIGAKTSAMDFMQIKMIKEVRNNINRSTNFETANLSKTTESSSEHIKAIKKIKSLKAFDNLPKSLQETAELRLSNPYTSLSDLALLHTKPVSKSGVNHRLKKLIKIAENLK